MSDPFEAWLRSQDAECSASASAASKTADDARDEDRIPLARAYDSIAVTHNERALCVRHGLKVYLAMRAER